MEDVNKQKEWVIDQRVPQLFIIHLALSLCLYIVLYSKMESDSLWIGYRMRNQKRGWCTIQTACQTIFHPL